MVPQQKPVVPQQAVVPQQPVAPPAVTLDPERNPLDKHLLQWEKAMMSVQTLVVKCTRTETLKTFARKDEYVGEAKYMRLPAGPAGQTDSLASLSMQMKGKPDAFERFVCTGAHLYQWLPQQKEIRVYNLPPRQPGQVVDDGFLSFLFGMKAEEAKRRYDLQLVKDDQHYIYVEIVPRFPADKADFQKARLVLLKSSFLPRQLWFQQPNGDEVLWDMPQVQAGPHRPQGVRRAAAASGLEAGAAADAGRRDESAAPRHPPESVGAGDGAKPQPVNTESGGAHFQLTITPRYSSLRWSNPS
jgi:TIGR03009 family protein